MTCPALSGMHSSRTVTHALALPISQALHSRDARLAPRAGTCAVLSCGSPRAAVLPKLPEPGMTIPCAHTHARLAPPSRRASPVKLSNHRSTPLFAAKTGT